MERIDFSDGTDTWRDRRFRNDGLPMNTALAEVAWTHALLADKYMRYVKVTEGIISHCRFEYVNLRNAVFDRVNLTGTVFIRCNLERATFAGCTLWFVEFDRCEVNYAAVMEALPLENNIRIRFLRSLRTNAEAMGEKAWVDKILLKELEAERKHLLDAAMHAGDYYVTRYSDLARLGAAVRLGWHYIRFGLWGYGLYLSRLAVSATLVSLLLATVATHSGFEYRVALEPNPRELSFFEGLYFTVINLTTVGLGDIVPANWRAQLLASMVAVLGVIMFGFIAAAFYRRLSR